MQDYVDNTRIEKFQRLPMRPAWGHVREVDEHFLRYVKQLGVGDLMIAYRDVRGSHRSGRSEHHPVVSYEELIHLRSEIEASGLRLAGFDSLPNSLWDDIIFGTAQREEQLAALKETVRNMGRAGIPLLGYHWYDGARRTTFSYQIRGEATASAYDHEEGKRFPAVREREYTEDEMWENYGYFIEEMVPVAEEAGVRLALHPTDPPLGDLGSGLGGIAYIFRNMDGFRRALSMDASDHHGLKFCFGCFSEMADVDVYDAIDEFGERIHHVHFRDVSGTLPAFNEEFIDSGDHDMLEAIERLRDVGFSGPLTPDHVPTMEGDTSRKHRAYGFTLGYLRGLLHAADPVSR